jgi:glycerophosphoryl diester phosphodiesterase
MDPPRKILISGHRGTRIHGIENTRAAFQYCLDVGTDCIEFDVQKTADGELVVFHDSSVKRLLDGTGRVEKLTLTQLKQMRYRDGQQIQTLREFFDQIRKRVRPILEIKSRKISEKVIALVRESGYQRDEIIIQSYDPADIVECHAIDPGFDYGLCRGLLGRFPIFQRTIAKHWYRRYIEPYPAKWLNLDGPFVYDAIVDEAINNGKRIILGSIKIRKFLPRLDRWHVDIVNADDPVQIRGLIKSMGYQVNE